jgi:hypothetical protein
LVSFSNYGPDVTIAAPGVDILSTYKNNSYAIESGTSMAAPVSGAAASYKESYLTASPAEIRANIEAPGSGPNTICDNGAHGYFTGDVDNTHEPLLFGKVIQIQQPSAGAPHNIQGMLLLFASSLADPSLLANQMTCTVYIYFLSMQR